MPRSTKANLESLGHDVADVRDFLPPAAPDSDVASLAVQENRIIITRDQDFANILLYPPERYPGIIVLRAHALKPAEMNRLIELFISTVASETILHSLIILEPKRYRIKK